MSALRPYAYSKSSRRWHGPLNDPSQHLANGDHVISATKLPIYPPFPGATGETRYTVADNGLAITCHRCGMTSRNINDVRQEYCGNCGYFE